MKPLNPVLSLKSLYFCCVPVKLRGWFPCWKFQLSTDARKRKTWLTLTNRSNKARSNRHHYTFYFAALLYLQINSILNTDKYTLCCWSFLVLSHLEGSIRAKKRTVGPFFLGFFWKAQHCGNKNVDLGNTVVVFTSGKPADSKHLWDHENIFGQANGFEEHHCRYDGNITEQSISHKYKEKSGTFFRC